MMFGCIVLDLYFVYVLFIVFVGKLVGLLFGWLFVVDLLCGMLLLWFMFFMSLLVIYLLLSWLLMLLCMIGVML